MYVISKKKKKKLTYLDNKIGGNSMNLVKLHFLLNFYTEPKRSDEIEMKLYIKIRASMLKLRNSINYVKEILKIYDIYVWELRLCAVNFPCFSLFSSLHFRVWEAFFVRLNYSMATLQYIYTFYNIIHELHRHTT